MERLGVEGANLESLKLQIGVGKNYLVVLGMAEGYLRMEPAENHALLWLEVVRSYPKVDLETQVVNLWQLMFRVVGLKDPWVIFDVDP